jgi:hypothetical protein
MEGIVSFRERKSELIGVILSAKHGKTWTGGEVICEKPNQMLALRTDFGWTLMGPHATGEPNEEIFNSYIIENEHETNLQDDINRMFRHDFFSIDQERREGQKRNIRLSKTSMPWKKLKVL